MVRDSLSVDSDARVYWPTSFWAFDDEDAPDWRDAETCLCLSLRMVRGRAECPECDTVYAVQERRSVRRWKTLTSWGF